MKAVSLVLRLLFCRLLQSPQFILLVKDGQVSRYSGTIKPGFVADAQDIIERSGVLSGFIYCVNGQFGSMLKASTEIPPNVLQQLRNVWNF